MPRKREPVTARLAPEAREAVTVEIRGCDEAVKPKPISYNSTPGVLTPLFRPPAARTFPVGSRVVVCCPRAVLIELVSVQAPVTGSYTSAATLAPALR